MFITNLYYLPGLRDRLMPYVMANADGLSDAHIAEAVQSISQCLIGLGAAQETCTCQHN